MGTSHAESSVTAPQGLPQDPPERPWDGQKCAYLSAKMAGWIKATRYNIKKSEPLSAKMQQPVLHDFVTSGFAYTKCPVTQK